MTEFERGRLRFSGDSEIAVEYQFTAGAYEPEVLYGSIVTNLSDLDPSIFASRVMLLSEAGLAIDIVFTDVRDGKAALMGTQAEA